MSKSYSVVWQMAIRAETPLKAAQRAIEMQRNRDIYSEALCFEVTEYATGAETFIEEPLIWNWKDMTVRELRHEGYAVIIWTPEELSDCPINVLEDLSIERGWEVIEQLKENNHE